MQTIEIVTGHDEKILQEILYIKSRAFPKKWEYDDAENYYREMLGKRESINIIAKEDKKIVGYLLAIPHNEAFKELKEHDPEMEEDPQCYYVETVAILPEFRLGTSFLKMLYAVIAEAKSRFGIKRFSMHARTSIGLIKAPQRYFGSRITKIRKVQRWRYYNYEESADYLEVSINGGPHRTNQRKPSFETDEECCIYTPLEDAKEEIWRRWNDGALRSCVNDFLGEIPEVLKEKPRAVLFRHIITPNTEYRHFLSVVNGANIEPLGWEFLKDRFCTRNADKVGLIKMAFLERKNGDKYAARQYRRIGALTTSDNKKLNDINTFGDEPLVDFHHRLLKEHAPSIEIFDASPWYMVHGKKAKEYYKYFLSLFICHGVLFENFITNEKEEKRFSKTIVMPAYREVVNRFGVKPLIVQLLPPDKAADNYWRCYPEDLMAEVEKCLAKKSTQTQCR